jgi:predicted Zn-dependent protease
MRRALLFLTCAAIVFGADPPKPAAAAVKPLGVKPGQASVDLILNAMKDELARARTLSIASLDQPYYVEYTMEDVQTFSVSATLGGIFSTRQDRFRVPRVRVRVGDYNFDNGNYIYSDSYSGTRYDSDQLPLDNNYGVLRRSFWLATDRAYKTAVEGIGRKRAALKNVTQRDVLPDFWQAAPVVKIIPGERALESTDKWTARVKQLSRIFLNYPEVITSVVSFDISNSVQYMHNSEGSTIRRPESLFYLQVRGSGQAPDGSAVRDSALVPRLSGNTLPSDEELQKVVREIAESIKGLASAPAGETYSGPVLVEGTAAAQMVAEVLAPAFTLSRRPVGEPGRPVPFLPSEFEGRVGSRVMPEFLSVVDDASQTNYDGTPLFGTYDLDEEGVAAQPLTLVEQGKLKTFVLSRQPVKGFSNSNGHARLPGRYGSRTATISNLFVKASETVPSGELRQRFLKMVQDRGKEYGLIIRKTDFPSSAPSDELRRLMMSAAQSGGGRPVSAPLLVYRVFPDGREELVRGLRFRGVTAKSFRDIAAVSDTSAVFHWMNNMAPFGSMSGGYVAPSSVIAPSMLFEDLELERPQDDLPKPPLVPPPPLSASR